MDSRTKFYGPVLAMLSLSAVAFSGFITPPLEIDESTTPEDRQENVQGDVQPSTGSTTNTPNVSDSDRETPDPGNSEASSPGTETSESNPTTTDENPEPLTLLDLLFIPISDDPSQQSAVE
ncbi:MAG: hypothetical protein AAF974_03965 [Cyanobacteria bacterium P01_E01_bin.34]